MYLRDCMHTARPTSTSRANPTDAGAVFWAKSILGAFDPIKSIEGTTGRDGHPKGITSFLLEMYAQQVSNRAVSTSRSPID